MAFEHREKEKAQVTIIFSLSKKYFQPFKG